MTEAETLQPLVVDLLEWCAHSERTYAEVMEAWRTSCPRLPVWETALDAGYIRRVSHPGLGAVVAVTPAGKVFLDASLPRAAT